MEEEILKQFQWSKTKIRQILLYFQIHFHFFVIGQFQDLPIKVIVKYIFYKIYSFRIYEYMWIFWWNISYNLKYYISIVE